MRKQLAKVAEAIFDSAGFSVRGRKFTESNSLFDLGEQERPFRRQPIQLPRFDIPLLLPSPPKAKPATIHLPEAAPPRREHQIEELKLYYDAAPDLHVALLPLNHYKRGEMLLMLAIKGFRLKKNGLKNGGVVQLESTGEPPPRPKYCYPLHITLRLKGNSKEPVVKYLHTLNKWKRAKRVIALARAGIAFERLQRAKDVLVFQKEQRTRSRTHNHSPSFRILPSMNSAPSTLGHANPNARFGKSNVAKGNGYGEE
jgi:hypothetical protein